MGDLGGQPPGGAQPFLAHGEFGGFGFGPLLFFKEHLDAVTAQRPGHQHNHAFDGVLMHLVHVHVGDVDVAVQHAASHERAADQKIEQKLRETPPGWPGRCAESTPEKPRYKIAVEPARIGQHGQRAHHHARPALPSAKTIALDLAQRQLTAPK